jgi:hypothetical protein
MALLEPSKWGVMSAQPTSQPGWISDRLRSHRVVGGHGTLISPNQDFHVIVIFACCTIHRGFKKCGQFSRMEPGCSRLMTPCSRNSNRDSVTVVLLFKTGLRLSKTQLFQEPSTTACKLGFYLEESSPIFQKTLQTDNHEHVESVVETQSTIEHKIRC